MKYKIAIATFGRQAEIVNNLSQDLLPENVELVKLNLALSDLTSAAKKMEQERRVDAFVASGGNAATLKQIIGSMPVVTIEATASDLISVIKEVSLRTDHAAAIFYENISSDTVKLLKDLQGFSNTALDIYFYSTRKQLESIIAGIAAQGITDVIGGSLALQIAAAHGLYGHYTITKAGIQAAIHMAADIVESKYKEAMQSKELSSVLTFIKEGIIAINRDDIITICNPGAERIFGIKASDVVGRRIDETLSNTRLNIVRQQGEKELNQIQREGTVNILTNRIPIKDGDTTIGALATFNEISEIENAEAQIRQKLYSKGLVAKYHFEDIIGSSVELKKIIVQAKEYAGSDATVLISGESGTGKELFAQSIHNYSRRSMQPFVAVNCAAMSSQLLESELFGYEEGAFTGAKRGGKRGVFELADTGTVFLDEIAEMSLETQAHLLRVLEQREVMRVGGERIRPVDIRVITATNKDLRQMVLDGTFRKDLYYRLNVLKIRIPSLRERSEDIPQLTVHFLRRFYNGSDIENLCAIAEDPLLRRYDWPGNIRELRNFAERISVLSGTSQNYGELVSDYFKPLLEAADNGAYSSDQRTIILNALKDNGGNRENTAKALGMSRSTLWRKMKEAGIE